MHDKLINNNIINTLFYYKKLIQIWQTLVCIIYISFKITNVNNLHLYTSQSWFHCELEIWFSCLQDLLRYINITSICNKIELKI